MSELRVFRYSIPNERHEGWAIMFCDNAGCLAVLSDYGNYTHRWNTNGWSTCCDPRRFLLSCDGGYILNTITRPDEVQWQETLESIKRNIIEDRRQGALEKREARDEWEILPDLLGSAGHDEWELGSWMRATKRDEPWTLVVRGPPQQAVAFMKRVWPRLMAAVRAELDSESVAPMAVAP